MFKPLLSPGEDPLRYPDYFKKLNYPLLCSPKYDGIRCLVKHHMCLSRSGKILPSHQVQEYFNQYEHFDGEVIEGIPNDYDVYNRTQSHVMSEDKPGDVKFYVFDYTHPDYLDKPFYERLEHLEMIFPTDDNVIQVIHDYVDSYSELRNYEETQLALGYEGIMLRNPVAPYKNGRATFREGIIYKLKRFTDDEAIIVDFVEQQHNTNKLEKDELGYAKRSTMKEGMVGAGTLGKFICDYKGDIIEVAPGNLNHKDRQEIWDNREQVRNQYLKFRFFNHGIKDKPRFPRAIGLRHQIDL